MNEPSRVFFSMRMQNTLNMILKTNPPTDPQCDKGFNMRAVKTLCHPTHSSGSGSYPRSCKSHRWSHNPGSKCFSMSMQNTLNMLLNCKPFTRYPKGNQKHFAHAIAPDEARIHLPITRGYHNRCSRCQRHRILCAQNIRHRWSVCSSLLSATMLHF